MDTIYSSIPTQWGHEHTPGRRIIPPRPDELVVATDDEGNSVTGPDGQFVMIPGPEWEQVLEEIQLDTVVLMDGDSNTVFKFCFDKAAIPLFLSHFISFLDADGRQVVREKLSDTSDVVAPTPDTQGLKLLTGGKTT